MDAEKRLGYPLGLQAAGPALNELWCWFDYHAAALPAAAWAGAACCQQCVPPRPEHQLQQACRHHSCLQSPHSSSSGTAYESSGFTTPYVICDLSPCRAGSLSLGC